MFGYGGYGGYGGCGGMDMVVAVVYSAAALL